MPADIHRLFFALVPDAAALQAVERVVEELRSSKAVRGRWTAAAKYHVTAYFLGDHRAPEPVIRAACNAAAGVAFAPFSITFDRGATFRGHYQVPCAQRSTPDSENVLTALWQQLGTALAQMPIDHEHHRRYVPHLTVAYADGMIAPPIPITPIHASVNEFVLVDSHVGQDRHDVVARWPLSLPVAHS